MIKETTHGIIAEHFGGVGTITREMVVQRAREIALINGHLPDHYTRDDFLEAKRELTGHAGLEDLDEEGSVTAITRWDEEPGTTGHAADKVVASDEQTFAELLVQEGVDEAEHEQMVEGARRSESE